MRRMTLRPMPRLLVLCCILLGGCLAQPPAAGLPGGRRVLKLELDGQWIGRGVSFSPYRDGQEPGQALPSDDELLADLRLVSPYWQLLRMYDSGPLTERALALIRRERLPVRLLLGAWINPERDETLKAGNRSEAENAIRLANAYPDLVLAVIVGNETCVEWSGHRSGPDVLIPWIRHVRRGVRQPVSTADDLRFWNKSESATVAAEIDFLTLHGYALWNSQPVEQAMVWTQDIHDMIARLHPGIPIVYGETGWATRHDPTIRGPGGEGVVMTGEVSVPAQENYLRQHYDWVARTRIPTILFEAFDENWKGGGAGAGPNVAEKHWGVFTADRKPKASFEAIIRDYYKR